MFSIPENLDDIPEKVSNEITAEFGKQPEGSKNAWNKSFNKLADELAQRIQSTKGSLGSTKFEPTEEPASTKTFEKTVAYSSLKFGENLAIEELKLLYKLADLAAKATGGRKLTSA